jgi:uncharacterized membrane protein
MLRGALSERNVTSQTNFRWRGNEITRIEGFSDAVFAFAVTLLVVSLEVPQTFNELLSAMRGFIAFAICFGLLASIWYYHYVFFRRYGLQDRYTILLNTILLFVVLFYVYPLKFVFTLLINQMLGDTTVQLPNGAIEPMIETNQGALLFVIYGVGYIAISLVFALMYYHAYRQREQLELTELEVLDTLTSMRALLLDCGVGALSIAIALIGGEGYTALAGFTYFLIGIERSIYGFIRGRQRRKLEARFASTTNSRKTSKISKR